MSLKRRIIYESEDDEDEDGAGRRSRHAPAAPDDTQLETTATRRSGRTGRGSGGRVEQLKQFEQLQMQRSKRPSRTDVATQGEDVNPMAPSSQIVRGGSSRKGRSDVPDQTNVQSGATLHSPSSQPMFSLAAPGDTFGFRLPPETEQSNEAPPHPRPRIRDSSTSSMPSVSLSSATSLGRGTSTAPTSRSTCSSTNDKHVRQRNPLASTSQRPSSSASGPPSWYDSELTPLAPPASRVRARQDKAPEPSAFSDLDAMDTARSTSIPRRARTQGAAISDREFDETTPSEDEREAEKALRANDGYVDALPSDNEAGGSDTLQQSQSSGDRAIGQPRANAQVPQDVLAVHRQRNRAPRLPSNNQLLAARERQCSSTNRAPDGSDQGNGQEPAAISVLPRGPTTGGAEPWQLQYYDPPTRDIIERAKQFSRCDAASINSFPVRTTFDTKAIEFIEEAIAERQRRRLIISEGWWPECASGITRLLWEDLGNWRSALKKKARTFVNQRYQWDPENCREQNMEIAKNLLGNGGLFLRDGSDEEGRVNNLAHPALSGLIVDFFYAGSTSVGKLFPEVFAEEVPRVTVAIAATALKVALDEIALGRGEVNFRVNAYLPVYSEILGLMNKCDTSPIHRAKTRDLRVRWAQLGSNGMTNQEPGIAGCGFDVVID